MSIKKAFATVLFVIYAHVSYADRVISCHDGDTCRVLRGTGQVVSVRIKGIDAPELSQPFGKESRALMTRLAVGKKAKLACKGKAQSREACWLFVNGQDLSRAMVRAGLAWDYGQFSGGYYQFEQLEAQARKRGLWKSDPISPYCWRHRERPACDNKTFQP